MRRLLRAMALGVTCAVVASAHAACGAPAEQAGPPFSVFTDSNGVQVVESKRSLWSVGQGWDLSDEPVFRLGGPSDRVAALYRVSGVAAVSRATPADGALIVAVAMGTELLFCNLATEEVLIIDRNGSGPGEFRRINDVTPYGDSAFAAYDSSLGRILIYDADGAHRRDVVVGEAAGDYALVGTLEDGSFVFAHHGMAVPAGQATVRYVIHGPNGGHMRIVETGAGFHWFTADAEAAPALPTRVPLAGAPVAYAADGAIYLGHGDTYEVRTYDGIGSLQRRVRRLGEERPLSTDVVASYEAASLTYARSEASRRRASSLWDQAPFPQMVPAFSKIIADADGNLWVCEGRLPGEGSCWVVFDRIGRLLGEVDVPEDLILHYIGSNYVVGLRFDGLGVPEVLVYRLDRSRNGQAPPTGSETLSR